jgi:hypothetical protein
LLSFLYTHSLKGLSPQKLYSHLRKWFPWRALYPVGALMNNSSFSQLWEQKCLQYRKSFVRAMSTYLFCRLLSFLCIFIFFLNDTLCYFHTALFDKSVLKFQIMKIFITLLYYETVLFFFIYVVSPVDYFVGVTKS